ncbi:MAG: polysaccharide deacetylase [Gemmatimonadetes bacterium]|nr:polysaccharide deacetylase [Gemmatimonadota bacterium]
MKLTILMYHKIDELTPSVRYPGNYVTPAQFARQMDALLMWGYRTIRFDRWLDYRDGRATDLPEKPLIVTFDDGYTCFDRNAWPVLKARGMGATVFLVAGQIGGTNAWDREEKQEPLLDAPRIRQLQGEGVHFGSHSYNHAALARIPEARALDELKKSRATLTAVLGRAPDVVAYPFSNQNRAIRRMAEEAGYRCAVRGKGRMNWKWNDPFGLRRIKPGNDLGDLRRTLLRERYVRVF